MYSVQYLFTGKQPLGELKHLFHKLYVTVTNSEKKRGCVMEISEKNLFEVYGWTNGEEKRIRQKSEMLPFT